MNKQRNKRVAILGISCTKFGELWNQSLTDLLAQAQLDALDDAKLLPKDLDALFVGNMCGELFSGQAHLGALATNILGIHIPGTRVEAACASGGVALSCAIQSILSEQAEVVIVSGVEKMTDVDPVYAATALMGASSFDYEHMAGATFPALFALVTRLYEERYGLLAQDRALVSVQNHNNGFRNSNAHIHKKITVDDVLNSPVIASPLTLLDCSPMSDGAASIILSSEDFARKHKGDGIALVGHASATDTLALGQRESLTEFKATQLAAQRAYNQAGITPDTLDVIELHDAFSTAQIIALEDLGICPRGQACKAITHQIINPSGGLKSRGHPVGATGIVQVVELVRQLRNTAGNYQVPQARIGLAHNMGGVGTTVTINILRSL